MAYGRKYVYKILPKGRGYFPLRGSRYRHVRRQAYWSFLVLRIVVCPAVILTVVVVNELESLNLIVLLVNCHIFWVKYPRFNQQGRVTFA